ncbi:MAG: DUF4390 domain-containing protein [Giesbergeria sp.]|nr:DUF4390 domain-containing protein [Giesbergeria sp.]
MASSTRCCTKRRPDLAALLLAAAAWLLCCGLLLTAPVRAQEAPPAPADTQPQLPPAGSALRLERSDDGVYLSTTLELVLPPLVEEALYQGIAIYFVTEAEVARERWYWSDKKIIRATRYARLSYQPLTRRWRLNLSSTPFEKTGMGLGVALGQNFDDLDEVLDTLQRIARWRIAEPDALHADTRYRVQLGFRLDQSQLPQPLHIGVLGRSGWDMAVVRSQWLKLDVEPQP